MRGSANYKSTSLKRKKYTSQMAATGYKIER